MSTYQPIMLRFSLDSTGGFPGINSGVLLLDLEKMRKSVIYQGLLIPGEVDKLAEEFKFKVSLLFVVYLTALHSKGVKISLVEEELVKRPRNKTTQPFLYY